MKHISILVPHGAVALSCIEGPFIMFNKANDFLIASGRSPIFHVQLVGLSQDAEIYAKQFSVKPDISVENVNQTDLIIIPAVNGEMEKVIHDNKDFFPWMFNPLGRSQ
jgi:hypothetical protein